MEATEFLLRLYLPLPPPPPPSIHPSLFFLTQLSESLSRLFKPTPPTPRGLFAQAILFRIKGVLAHDPILPSDT